MNGNVYGYVWFLDQVGKEWDALVEGDYESVMPLVWRKHWSGGKEIFQPHFMRELGIYSTHVLSQKRINKFLEAIPKEYRLIRMTLNERNTHIDIEKHKVTKKTNHQIFLQQPYEVLRSAYSAQYLEKLKIASEEKFIVTTSLKPEQIADFYKANTEHRLDLDRNYFALQRIMYNILHRGWGYASGISDVKQNLLACNFFIYSHNKAISFIPTESPAGEKVGALPHLMDVFIRNHANRPIILDLNTKTDSSLSRSLGGQANHYYQFSRRPAGVFGQILAHL